jgi:hypothetical protein
MILCVPARAMGPGELSSSNLPPKQMLRCAPGFLATRAPGNHLLRCVASHPASGEVFGISARLTCPIISDLRVCRRVAEVPFEGALEREGRVMIRPPLRSRHRDVHRVRGTRWGETRQQTTIRPCRASSDLGIYVMSCRVCPGRPPHNPWVVGSIPTRPTRSEGHFLLTLTQPAPNTTTPRIAPADETTRMRVVQTFSRP